MQTSRGCHNRESRRHQLAIHNCIADNPSKLLRPSSCLTQASWINQITRNIGNRKQCDTGRGRGGKGEIHRTRSCVGNRNWIGQTRRVQSKVPKFRKNLSQSSAPGIILWRIVLLRHGVLIIGARQRWKPRTCRSRRTEARWTGHGPRRAGRDGSSARGLTGNPPRGLSGSGTKRKHSSGSKWDRIGTGVTGQSLSSSSRSGRGGGIGGGSKSGSGSSRRGGGGGSRSGGSGPGSSSGPGSGSGGGPASSSPGSDNSGSHSA
ncbi:hypothetical protein WISP_62334 [Willisornis vidua]|uniref:Uncharacterized protein n=1 Tax=Willisornis vidua TaxID=1566151 RepID=A0ABQ9DGA1_9PASS|nr:hypothetical protein WISP_62334 [Willisornis vidua]